MFKKLNDNWKSLTLNNVTKSIVYGLLISGSVLYTSTNLPIKFQESKNESIKKYENYSLKEVSQINKFDKLNNIKEKEPIVVVIDNGEHAKKVMGIIETQLKQQLNQYSENIIFINKILSVDDKNEEELKNIIKTNNEVYDGNMLNNENLINEIKKIESSQINNSEIIKYLGEKYPKNNIYINMSFGEKTGFNKEEILNTNNNIFSSKKMKDFVFNTNKENEKIIKYLNLYQNIKLIISSGNNQKLLIDNDKDIKNSRDYLIKFYVKITNGDINKMEEISLITRDFLLSNQNKLDEDLFIKILNDKNYNIENNEENKVLFLEYLKYSSIDLNSDFDKLLLLKSFYNENLNKNSNITNNVSIVESISIDTFKSNYKLFKKQKNDYPLYVKTMANLPSDNMDLRSVENFKNFINKYKDKFPELFISNFETMTTLDYTKNKTKLDVDGQILDSENGEIIVSGTSFSAPSYTSSLVVKDYENESKKIYTNNDTSLESYNQIFDYISEIK